MSEPVVSPPPLAGFGLDDENHNVKIIVGTGVTTFFALIIVCVRVWVRSSIVRRLGGDDYWILAALVSDKLYADDVGTQLMYDRHFPLLALPSLSQKWRTEQVAICFILLHGPTLAQQRLF